MFSIPYCALWSISFIWLFTFAIFRETVFLIITTITKTFMLCKHRARVLSFSRLLKENRKKVVFVFFSGYKRAETPQSAAKTDLFTMRNCLCLDGRFHYYILNQVWKWKQIFGILEFTNRDRNLNSNCFTYLLRHCSKLFFQNITVLRLT